MNPWFHSPGCSASTIRIRAVPTPPPRQTPPSGLSRAVSPTVAWRGVAIAGRRKQAFQISASSGEMHLHPSFPSPLLAALSVIPVTY